MEPNTAVLTEAPQAMQAVYAKAPADAVSLPAQDHSVSKASLVDLSSVIIPEVPPDLNIPDSQVTVKVSIIDTTSYMSNFAMSGFLDPLMPGHEEMKACDFSFIIEHPKIKSCNKYDTLLFDLGVRKDWENLPTTFVQAVKEGGCKIEVQKDVATILKENGRDLSEVGGIIWSHWHFDHVGDVQTFPSTTDIIVGPGFKKAHVPAWPTVPDSHIDERAWQGRTLREIDFAGEGHLKIGQFDALDFYGDGSFYLLNTPGHTIGHLSALARTTIDPPTFIFMGGDIAHQCGEFRPTPYMPLPAEISPNPFKRTLARPAMACPGDIFVDIHRSRSRIEPFFDPTTAEGAWHHCAHEAKRTIDKLTEFDAYENIFPVIAHDNSLYGVVDVYPKPANDWLARGWKDTTRWGWLSEFDPGSEGLARASEE